MSVSAACLALAVAALAGDAPRIGPHYWPTPNPRFVQGGAPDELLQPTASGELESALFGCVRNDGRRFHEGVDLKPVARDSRGESIDPVFAFHAGVVRYVNRAAGSSSYGRYVVVEHPEIAPALVSVYAHLRSIPDGIREGVAVQGGQKLGVMGRSAGGYTIPKSRAHLHFELGLWLGPDFQQWYDQQPFTSENDHGAFNGMNIVGLDVWAMLKGLQRGEVSDAWAFALSEAVAVEVYVPDARIPALLKENAPLLTNRSMPRERAGWRIGLTWYGLPVSFTALEAAELPSAENVAVKVLRPDLIQGQDCIELVRQGRPGSRVESLVGRLFP